MAGNMKSGVVIAAIALSFSLPMAMSADAPAQKQEPKKEAPVEPKAALKPYPLTTCMVSGEKVDVNGKPVVIEYKGRELKFCCNDCVDDFKKDPEKYLKKLEGK